MVLFALLAFSIPGIVEASTLEPGVVFPFVTYGNNVTTLITIMVPGDVNCLTFEYRYKPRDAQLTDDCTDYEFQVETSPNDLMTFDVGAHIGGGKALYGDKDSKVSGGYPLSLYPKAASPVIGYLIVYSCLNSSSGQPDGEAVIMDLEQGTSWAYRAFSYSRYHEEQAVLGNGYAAPTSWLPTKIAKTQFIVTPVPILIFTSQSAVVRLGMFDRNGFGVFDRNEVLYPQTVEKKVTCVGIIDINDLLSTTNAANPQLKAQGGWSFLTNVTRREEDLIYDAWVFKVETGSQYGLEHGSLPKNMDTQCPTFARCSDRNLPRLEPVFVNAVPNGGKFTLTTPAP